MSVIEKYYIEDLNNGFVLYPDGTPDYYTTVENPVSLSGLWQIWTVNARKFDTRAAAFSHISQLQEGQYRVFSRIDKVADN
tara:strand:+ start:580 stop:822 length:243 start_codon:yes stop_codon:yes gene_type:complete